MLKKRGVGYNMVVTKISFDMEAPTPKLVFKPVGFLDEAGFRAAQEAAASDVVKNILGAGFAGSTPVAIGAKAETKVDSPVQEPKAPVEAAPAPKAEKSEIKVDLDLSDLNFDD